VPPSSSRTARRGISDLTGVTSDFFRIKHLPGLIARHTPAQKSAYARNKGETPTFDNQTQTLKLDEEYRGKLDCQTVLLTDDFITGGLSMEGCRNFLMAGGVSRVLAVAVGRFGQSAVRLWSPRTTIDLDPWAPSNLGAAEFETEWGSGSFDSGAVTQFEEAWSTFVEGVG
jgi:hypothetical protein